MRDDKAIIDFFFKKKDSNEILKKSILHDLGTEHDRILNTTKTVNIQVFYGRNAVSKFQKIFCNWRQSKPLKEIENLDLNDFGKKRHSSEDI